MTETKSIEPSNAPEPDGPKERQPESAFDPGQTRLLPPNAPVIKQKLENNPAIDLVGDSGLSAKSEPANAPVKRVKKLSQPQIIWISFSIILIFLAMFLLLIMQGRHKNKMLRLIEGEQLEEGDKIDSIDATGILKNKLARQAAASSLLLTDDEFAGQAPMAVNASGPVISAVVDPELAALVDALKIRLKISAESKVISRGNIVTRLTKGDFRGFAINVEEKIENQNVFSEEITVITPQKGFIKTVNRVLESIRESALESFTVELQNAGLEIVKLPFQPGDKTFRVQLKTVSIFGKPIANDILISGNSLGKISLGMPTTQLEVMLLSSYIILKRKVLFNDIYHDVYKILDQNNEPLFFIYENKGRVWGISIISEIFKTAKGIGIGSSLGDMRINYPRLNVGISDKKTLFIKIDGLDGLFVMQSEGVDIIKQIFPSKIKVISILIGNALEFE